MGLRQVSRGLRQVTRDFMRVFWGLRHITRGLRQSPLIHSNVIDVIEDIQLSLGTTKGLLGAAGMLFFISGDSFWA